MPKCCVCSKETAAAAELACCENCQASAHRECRETAKGTCPKCGGRLSSELFFAPVTPGLDMLYALTGGVAGLAALLFIAAIAGLLYSFKDGVAFYYVLYFYFAPAAGLLLLFGGSFVLTWYLRGEARRPKRVGR